MKINITKSTSAIFNTSKTRDFAPHLKSINGKEYTYTENFKLLGVNFQTDPRKGLTWEPYILAKMKSAYANMWTLRRLSEMGISTEKLLLIYKSKIRVHVEMNVPLWSFSINQNLAKKLENVQRTAAFLILRQKASKNYLLNLKKLNLDTLETRRHILIKRFARKTVKHPAHKKMFKLKIRNDTRSTAPIIIPKAKRKRYMNSAVPSLARIIVENNFK